MAITTAFLIATAIKIAVVAAVNLTLSLAQKALAKKPKSNTESLDFEQIVQRRIRAGQPAEVLVGRRIVAGVAFNDDSYGTKLEHGVAVTVASAKPCTQFHRLLLDGIPVELSGDPTLGEVNVTSHFLGINDIPRVRVRVFLGHDNSGLGSYLAGKFPSLYTSNDRHGDYCVYVIDARNTNDDFDEEENKNFIPFQSYPRATIELSGSPICDPSDGGVYGDESTYVYSDNAGLIDAQYDFGWYSGVGVGRRLMVGNGYPVELMPLDRINRNKQYCEDEGFTCAGVLRSGENGDQDEIRKCYNADRVEHAASVFSIPEGDREVSIHLNMEDHPAAIVSNYDAEGLSTEVYNEIKTVYSEPEELFGEKELPIYSRPEWIASDNHIPRQTDLPLLFVTNAVSARKLEMQEIGISRAPATCTVQDLPYGFIALELGSLITISNSEIQGVDDRTWIVKGLGQDQRGDVSLFLREYAGSDVFGFDPDTDMPDILITPPVVRAWEDYFTPADYVGIETALNLRGVLSGTVALNDVVISGRGSITGELDSSNTNMSSGNSNSAVSGSLSQPYAFGSRQGTGSVTTNTVTVDDLSTTNGSISSETWSYVSGDTSFTINNPTQSSANFQSDLAANEEFKAAIFEYVATDDLGETLTLSVSVSIYKAEVFEVGDI